MSQELLAALGNGERVLRDILNSAIPKGHGDGYLLEAEGCEMDALRELSTALTRQRVERKRMDEEAPPNPPGLRY